MLGERLGDLLAARPASQRAGCGGSPVGPLLLPAPPPGAVLGVRFCDGRASRWDRLWVIGGRWFWALEDACSALRATLFWDPAWLEGELVVDSLRVRLVVGSELLRCGEQMIQLADRVLYLENRLLLPVSFASRIVGRLLPERWHFDADSLLLSQRPPGPGITRLRIQEARERVYLRWDVTERPDEQLLFDGAGRLIVEMGGMQADPRGDLTPPPRAGACLRAIWPHSRGTRFIFAIGEPVAGWRTEWRGDRGEFRIVLTTAQADLNGWQAFQPWPATVGAEGPGGPTVLAGRREAEPLILVLPSLESEPRQQRDAQTQAALRFVRQLGEQLAAAWAALGGEVQIIEQLDSRTRAPWTAAVNATGRGICLRLVPDFVGDAVARGYRIVTVSRAPSDQALRDLQAPPAAQSLRPWADVASPHLGTNAQLAWILALHLQAAAPEATVRREGWPVAALRGLDMPGAVLYVGRRGEAEAYPGVEDESSLAQTAEAIALGLEAFQLQRVEMEASELQRGGGEGAP
ncbi:MAG: hypothetical protein GF330_04005 [Candidatus Eisenbacteria bacterium]|nr:hypothetical protein [Candidatus Eisenbacteria bacterium]